MGAPRFYVETRLQAGALLLPTEVARHCQVLRLQPGAPVVLFDGHGGEWQARITRMGAREVDAVVETHTAVDRELPLSVTLAFGMPANDRMDGLIEKATELGAACLQPLVCERSVLRLDGDRAAKKVAHWQKVAVSACEQSGRTRVPVVNQVTTLAAWVAGLDRTGDVGPRRWLLSPPQGNAGRASADGVPSAWSATGACVFLSGPEGGLSDAEADAACAADFRSLSLGPRVLRADTAPLAALAWATWAAQLGGRAPASRNSSA